MSTPIPLCDCPCCTETTMLWVGTFFGDSSCNGSFVSDNLVYSTTAVGGVSPGWRWSISPGKIDTCNIAIGPPPPKFYLREIVLWCAGGVWNMEIVVVFNNGGSDVQDSFSTIGGSLDAVTLNNPVSPRTFYTRTHGDGLIVNGAVSSGHYRIDFRAHT